ncbi:MAG: AIR carboxylase family protein [Anaerolineae bacterium]|nr:AIR carboxylase family protein [Anaerolineae bacterium]
MAGFAVILMGSKADMEHAQVIANELDKLGIEAVMRVGSAHKTPGHVLEILKQYETDARPKVYITIAGRSNALSAFVDGQVTAPVIACPPYSDRYGGVDIFSSLRMPGGIAPAVVLDPSGAALLASKMLGIGDSAIRKRIEKLQQDNRDKITTDDAELIG